LGYFNIGRILFLLIRRRFGIIPILSVDFGIFRGSLRLWRLGKDR
jgi:hypothetical protein